LNTIVAWGDLLLSRTRSFSKRSELVSHCIIVFYMGWILTCARFNQGLFPYPFLNVLPWPQGFCGVALVSTALFYVVFRMGRVLGTQLMQRKVLRASCKAD
jgi:hypothetical protein